MNPIVVIPARMAATRLPDKPLADIGGHVDDRARAAPGPGGGMARWPWRPAIISIVHAVKQAGERPC